MRERVAVIDGGGRGSVLVDAYADSAHVSDILSIPGNDSMQTVTEKKVRTYPNLKTTDVEQIVKVCEEEKVSLVDVAQDNAVAAGLVDALNKAGIKTVGPTRAAGEIEWNKTYSRELSEKAGLLQPRYWSFESVEEGISFLNEQEDQEWFVKANELAEGKGALPAKSTKEAIERIKEVKKFGKRFLIEEWMAGDNGEEGEEFSSFHISDGETVVYLGSAQDHKRALNFDEGDNTGGMGCSCPPLVVTSEQKEKVIDYAQIIINQLDSGGRPYKGVLYGGWMSLRKTGVHEPYLVEWNARWGDPEAQALIAGIKTDFFELSMAVAEGKLKNLEVVMDNKARVVIAGVSRGYPGNYDLTKGKQIFGLEDAAKVKGVQVYGAGIKIEDNKNYAFGGRLFYIVGEGNNVIEAREKAYQAMSLVSIEGNNLHFRTDIGWRDVERVEKG